jgi:purine-binding chemotaxis protein CheW
MTVPRHFQSSSIDWAEVRRRVEVAGRAAGSRGEISPERAREILEQRARELAAVAAPERGDAALEVMTFGVADQTYAIETRCVVEVFRLGDLALLPGAQPPTVGLTGWRGRLLTILDLRRILGLSAAAPNGPGYVIVLGAERPAFGILADTLEAIVTLAASDVRSPHDGIAVNRTYICGVAGDALPLLDARALLSVNDGTG